MEPGDWDAVRAIYLEGIAIRNATFETDAPGWEKWDRDRLSCCRLVARDGTGVLGWAALSPVSSRPVYAGVAEASIYVAARARGRGVGAVLLQALITASEQAGIWTLQAGIFPENAASLPARRISDRRHSRTHRLHGRPLARHDPDGAPQRRRRSLNPGLNGSGGNSPGLVPLAGSEENSQSPKSKCKNARVEFFCRGNPLKSLQNMGEFLTKRVSVRKSDGTMFAFPPQNR